MMVTEVMAVYFLALAIGVIVGALAYAAYADRGQPSNTSIDELFEHQSDDAP